MIRNDEVKEQGLRPGALTDFIGQQKILSNLITYIKGAKKKG